MRIRRPKVSYAFQLTLPSLLVTAALVFYPMLHAFYLSFFRHRTYEASTFVGLGNYLKALVDPQVFSSLSVTLIFVVLIIVLTLFIGLLAALLLDKDFRGRDVCRSILLIPFAVSPVATSLMFKWLLFTRGMVNYVLMSAGIIDSFIVWYGDPRTAIYAVVLAWIWKVFPFTALLILAALQQVPKSLHDAAMIDGAGSIKRFIYITFPAITPIILALTIILTMWGFKSFPFFFALTRGGPGDATLVLEYLVYRVAFKQHDFGYGSALSYYMVIITSVAAYLYIRLLGRRGTV